MGKSSVVVGGGGIGDPFGAVLNVAFKIKQTPPFLSRA